MVSFVKVKVIVATLIALHCMVFLYAQEYQVERLQLNLPQEMPIVKEIAMDTKQMLWFTANNTLYRFDGFRSVDVLSVFKQEFPLLEPDKIVATATNEIIFTSQQDVFSLDLITWNLTNLGQPYLMDANNYKCNHILQLNDGRIMFLYESGDIIFYQKGQWSCLPQLKSVSAQQVKPRSANFAMEDRSYIWVATSRGSLVRIAKEQENNVKEIQLFPAKVSLESLIKGRGGFWIDLDQKGLYFYDGQNLDEAPLPLDGEIFKDVHVITENEYFFAVANKYRLLLVSKNTCEVIREVKDNSWQPSNFTSALFEGDHIFLASTLGVFQVKPPQDIFKMLRNPFGRASARGIHVFNDGATWQHSYGGALYTSKEGEIQRFNSFTNGYAILPLSDSQLLLGSEGDFLKVFDKEKEQVVDFAIDPKELAKLTKKDRFVISMAQDNYFYYLGTYNGLWKLNKITRQLSEFKDAEGRKATRGLAIRHITVQDSMSVQVSTAKGYLEFVDKKMSYRYPSDFELGMYKHIITPQGAWLASNGGGVIALDANRLLKNRYVRTNGLASNLVYDLLTVGRHIVVLTDAGLSLLTDDGLLRQFTGQELFSKMEFNHGAQVYNASTGDVYLGGVEGYTVLSDTLFKTQPNHTDAWFISEVVLPSNKDRKLKNNYAFPYTEKDVLSLDANDLMVSFQFGRPLTALAKEYGHAKVKGEINMEQTIALGQPYAMVGMAPGSYSIEIKGSANSATPLVKIGFQKKPYFYTTWWFYMLLVLFLALVLYWWYWLKKGIKKKEMAYRNQIAADLHDEVGAHLSALVLEGQWLQTSQQGKIVKAFGKEVQRMGLEAMVALREIIAVDQKQNKTWETFLGSLREYVEKAEIEKKVKVRFHIVGKPPNQMVPSKLEFHLFRIYKEIIVNILKHANATKINIELRFHKGVFSLVISDDGIGFDPGAKYDGNGLKNIKMRVQQIGATCDHNRLGTEFSFHFSYGKTPPRKGWFYFKRTQ